MRKLISILAAIALLLMSCHIAAAQGQTPDELLKSKGLIKVGAYFLLDADAKLPQSLRAIRQADAQMETYTRRRHFLEDEIEKTQNSQIQWGNELDGIRSRLSQNPDPQTQNDLVFQANQRITALKQADQYIEQCQKDLRQLQTPPDSSGLTVNLVQSMEDAAKQYDALGNDDAVKAALAQINQNPGVKFRLGPSAQFKSQLPILQRQRDKMNAAPIHLEFSGGVPHVQATINGSVDQSMVVDSGAASVILTHDVAAKAGLSPGPDARSGTFMDANGHSMVCRIMKLSSLRVGPYAVGDVECAILPDGENAECLLGGTFLHNFLYRMDLGTGQLFLTPVAGMQMASAQASQLTSTTRPAMTKGPATLEISATVDGTDIITITSSGLSWSHKDASWPTDVRVNGTNWEPQVNQLLSSADSLAFLRSVNFSTARVIEKSGRGIVAMQAGENSVEVDFVDPDGGTGPYDIKIAFTKNP